MIGLENQFLRVAVLHRFYCTIRMSSSLDPDQARHFVESDQHSGSKLSVNGYQETTKVAPSKERVNMDS